MIASARGHGRWPAPSRFLPLLAVCLQLAWLAQAGEPTALLSGPGGPVQAGSRISIWLHRLNNSAGEISASFPAQLDARLLAGTSAMEAVLELRSPSEAGTALIRPGGFVQREYSLALPETLVGTVVLEVPLFSASRLALEVVKPAKPTSVASGETGKSAFAKLMQEAERSRERPYSPGQFFKEHFFGYEPFYFLAGTESPNAKFQISMRYQIFSSGGLLAKKLPLLEGLNAAYTQTSLWDWNAPSAPFLDSSYKPELLYLWQSPEDASWPDWFRLDLQGGLQHESNGKADADSRSLNIAYFRPTAVFGKDDAIQFTLAPRVWCYVGGLDDNPDLADYRGYADLRATVGWKRGLQLSATGRLGDDGNHGSLQLDLTYPMMRLFSGSLSVYLQAQYFTGYGESLLLYNEKSDAFRVGFALYR